MTSTTAPTTRRPASAPASARTLMRLLERLQHGSLAVQWPDGSTRTYGRDEAVTDPSQPRAQITLHHWRVCSAALRSGDVGFAESYIAGDWSTPHLADLLRLMLANREALESVIYGSWAARAVLRMRHWLHRNHRRNSRKNIHAHYDLGNAFYRLWLDETMNYSSAWFDGDHGQPMAVAQGAKVRRALRMADVQPGDRVLEIGCGWGALAETAVREFGASITGVTLSTEQLAFAQERLARLGAGRAGVPGADLRLQDYRDIQDPPFDAICSIEMLEAVGAEYWPTYFRTVQRLLKPGGRACIQSIVIDDRLFERYLQSTDFIQQYIFPGGCLPSPQRLRAAARAAGLEVVDELPFGRDYAETLRQWRQRFLRERAAVLQLGFDERFMRLWEFYLAYCEAAFDMDNIDVVQYTLRRPSD